MEKYTYEEMVKAYLHWASMAYDPIWPERAKKRMDAWDRYCDLRDQLLPGTSFARRTGVPQSQEIAEPEVVH